VERADAANDPPFEVHTKVDAKAYPGLVAARVALSAEEVDVFYKRFSKEAFWPTLHTFWERAIFREEDWKVFLAVNRKFAERTATEAAQGATVWLHDYNLWMVPAALRELRPDLKIAFFTTRISPRPMRSTCCPGGVKLSAACSSVITSASIFLARPRISSTSPAASPRFMWSSARPAPRAF
jgi:trehalose-6-phosphate synthase